MRFSELEGETLVSVSECENEECNTVVTFNTLSGRKFEMFHPQNCCESVILDDRVGDWESVLGSPVLVAEERSSYEHTGSSDNEWTFYTIRTVNGTVDMRWFGTSNGYYSTAVLFREVEKD